MRLVGLLCALLSVSACQRGEKTHSTAFDGERALQYVKTQLDFGPRVPGSEGHRRTGDWIVAEMRQRADTVIEQQWTHVTAKGDTLHLRNILARFRPTATERVLYLAHWDTRPVSDGAEAKPAQHSIPVPGANDGASGVALLMGVADVLKRTPPSMGVDLLFVDGEDYGDFPSTIDSTLTRSDVLLGSRYFAENPPSSDYKPMFGVLWDMIGDRNLQIYQEGNSVDGAPEVVRRVWDQAAELGYQRYFVPEVKYTVTDDHIPLLRKGLRVIDVIDFDFPAHHTPDDTLDKVSAKSLQVVGDVAVSLILGR